MFRITEDPSSGSLVHCLAKNCKNYSIVSVDMDKVGVMAAYCDPLCLCIIHFTGRHSFLLCCWVACVCFVRSILIVSLFLNLWIICSGRPLFWAIIIILFHSCFFASCVAGIVVIILCLPIQ